MKNSTGFVFDDTDLFPQCHGSTLEMLPGGRLMAAWYGGSRESHPDTAIYYSTMDTESHEWNQPRLAAKISEEAHWNPVLFRDPNDCVHLYFKVGNTIPQWKTWHSVIPSSARVFREPRLLVENDIGGRGPVRNKMAVLSNGTWIAPASHEKKYINRVFMMSSDIWDSFMDLSEDGGETWKKTDYFGRKIGLGIIQPAVWESSPGNVHALMRSNRGLIYRSDSSDSGRTWSDVYKTDVPNNNSAVDVVKFESGMLALVYNPVSGNWASRTPVSVVFSMDNGATWGKRFDIEHSENPGSGFAYPSAIRSPKGMFVSYTWNRVGIRCVELSIDEDLVRSGNIEDGVMMVESLSVPDSMKGRLVVRKEAVLKRRLGWE